MLFLYTFLIYLKTELDLSTKAFVAGMTKNISKTLFFPICFLLLIEMV